MFNISAHKAPMRATHLREHAMVIQGCVSLQHFSLIPAFLITAEVTSPMEEVQIFLKKLEEDKKSTRR